MNIKGFLYIYNFLIYYTQIKNKESEFVGVAFVMFDTIATATKAGSTALSDSADLWSVHSAPKVDYHKLKLNKSVAFYRHPQSLNLDYNPSLQI